MSSIRPNSPTPILDRLDRLAEHLERAGEVASKVVPAPIRKVAFAITAPIYLGASFGAVGATIGGTIGALGGPLGLISVGFTGFTMGASIGASLGAQLGLAALSSGNDER